MAKHRRRPDIRVKRVYENPTPTDGWRVLVDRIWPRGLSKENAALDRWVKEVAPSTELRKWFGHDPQRWDPFQTRYRRELEDRTDEVQQLSELAAKKRLTLLYAAKDERHNHALVLKSYLDEQA